MTQYSLSMVTDIEQKTYTPNEWDELGKKNGDAADESNKLGEIPSKLQLSAEL